MHIMTMLLRGKESGGAYRQKGMLGIHCMYTLFGTDELAAPAVKYPK